MWTLPTPREVERQRDQTGKEGKTEKEKGENRETRKNTIAGKQNHPELCGLYRLPERLKDRENRQEKKERDRKKKTEKLERILLQGNRTTPSYVGFTDSERLIGDAAKNQEQKANCLLIVLNTFYPICA